MNTTNPELLEQIPLFEKWARNEDWCVDWVGNDSYDHSHTMGAWKMWMSIYRCIKGIDLNVS